MVVSPSSLAQLSFHVMEMWTSITHCIFMLERNGTRVERSITHILDKIKKLHQKQNSVSGYYRVVWFCIFLCKTNSLHACFTMFTFSCLIFICAKKGTSLQLHVIFTIDDQYSMISILLIALLDVLEKNIHSKGQQMHCDLIKNSKIMRFLRIQIRNNLG